MNSLKLVPFLSLLHYDLEYDYIPIREAKSYFGHGKFPRSLNVLQFLCCVNLSSVSNLWTTQDSSSINLDAQLLTKELAMIHPTQTGFMQALMPVSYLAISNFHCNISV